MSLKLNINIFCLFSGADVVLISKFSSISCSSSPLSQFRVSRFAWKVAKTLTRARIRPEIASYFTHNPPIVFQINNKALLLLLLLHNAAAAVVLIKRKFQGRKFPFNARRVPLGVLSPAAAAAIEVS